MRTKIIYGLLICMLLHIKCYCQYYDFEDPLQVMQQTQQYIESGFNEVHVNYSYKSLDGKKLVCSLTLMRLSGFSNANAYIQNRDGSKRQNLTVDGSVSSYLSIITNIPNWILSYGDRITITFNEDYVRTLDVGISDNMTEEQWRQYANSIILAKRNELQSKIKGNTHQNINGNSYNSYNTQIQSGNQTKLKQVPCSFCNGTGFSSAYDEPPNYSGSTPENVWCDICKAMRPPHAHKVCPVCHGLRYTESYAP